MDSDKKDLRQAAQAFVSRQYVVSGEEDGPPTQKDEVLEIHNFTTEPAKVTVEMGMTVNLGNYESARIAVALVLPCYKEEIEDAYEFGREWVEKRTLSEADAARKFAAGRKNPF